MFWTFPKTATAIQVAQVSVSVDRGQSRAKASAKIVRFDHKIFSGILIFINFIILEACGNFIVTGNEDCDDGTDSCNPDSCKCQPGYLPSVLDKKCIPVPADYVPKVGPSLDCLKIDGDLVQLFFSFVSTDPFDQRIEFGKMNYFIPDEFAVSLDQFSNTIIFNI